MWNAIQILESESLYHCIASRVELNVADGTYELHPTSEEEAVADLHHVGVEPMTEQVEYPFTNPKSEGKPRSINSYL